MKLKPHKISNRSRMNTGALQAVWICILALTLPACRQQAPAIESPEEVRIIDSIQLRLRATLHGSTPPMLGEGSVFALDEDGQVAILDRINSTIQIYDHDLVHIGTIGRKGQGPGEISGGEDLEFGPSGEIVVADRRNGRISIWSRDGGWLGSIPFTRRSATFAGNDQELWLRSYTTADSLILFQKVEIQEMALSDPHFAILRIPIFERLEAGARDLDDDSDLACPTCKYVLASDNTFAMIPILDEADFHATRFDDSGTITGLIDSPRKDAVRYSLEGYVRTLARAREEEINRSRAQGISERVLERRRIDPDSVRSATDVASLRPKPSYGTTGPIGIDGQGRIWLLPNVSDEEPTALDIFARDGGYLGTVTMEQEILGIAVRGKHILSYSLDDLGIPMYYIFDISE